MTARRRIDARDPAVKQVQPRPDQQNGNGFWPAPLTVCSKCAALLPGSERAQETHQRFHEQIAGLEDGRAR
jgi:hypothetical protein